MARNVYVKDKPLKRFIRHLLQAVKLAAVAVGIFLIFIGISYLLIHSYRFIVTSDIFLTKEIEVRNLHYLNKEEVLSIAGIKKGMNIFKINLTRVKRSLLKDPWIKAVVLKRVIPDRIVVEVKERKPVFIQVHDGRPWYVDSNGELIAPMESWKMLSLPLLEEKQKGYASTIYGFLSKISPYLPLKNIGWVKATDTFIRCYDYRRDILWIFDRDYLETERDTARRIWCDLIKRGEARNIERILVIKNLGWVTHKNLAG